MIMPLVDFKHDLRLFIGEQQPGLSSSFIKVLAISYLLFPGAARTVAHMKKRGPGFFCGLSPGLRKTSHLVETESLATAMQTCPFLRGMEQKRETTI